MEVNSVEYDDYFKMTSHPDPGMKIIGKGEAAAIAMVKQRGGILASNNMRDIASYISKYNLGQYAQKKAKASYEHIYGLHKL